MNLIITLLKNIILFLFTLIFFSSCDLTEETKKINLSERISDQELREKIPVQKQNALRFGFDLRASPQEDAKQYLPFLKYLERKTGYKFDLRFTAISGSIVDDLGTGAVHFAAIGAGSYIQARAKYGVIPLVRGLNKNGIAEYQSVIFVKPGSRIRNIEELAGKQFAFGSVTSTQGHLIPLIVLLEHGLSLKDLSIYQWTGSHQNCANIVTSGGADAGGIQDMMGRELEKAGIIKIIYTSKFYPSSCIAAYKEVPGETLNKVKNALIDFQPVGRDAEGLYNWDKTEMPKVFIKANDKDYAELRDWAEKLRY